MTALLPVFRSNIPSGTRSTIKADRDVEVEVVLLPSLCLVQQPMAYLSIHPQIFDRGLTVARIMMWDLMDNQEISQPVLRNMEHSVCICAIIL
jgi:hypothetical protein